MPIGVHTNPPVAWIQTVLKAEAQKFKVHNYAF